MRKELHSIISVNLLIFFILIVLLEISARLFFYFIRGSSTIGIQERTIYLQYEPFVMFGPKWDTFLSKHRYPEGQYDNRSYRILLLGGSTAGNFPVQIFKNTLKKKFPYQDFEVINAAHGGYNARQELIVATIWGIQLKPDMIITIDGANDLIHRLIVQKAGTFYLDSAYELALKRPFLAPLVEILRHSQFIQGICRLYARINLHSAKQYADAIPTYISAQHSINIIAKGLSSKRVMVLQPFMAFKNPLSESERKFSHYKYRENIIKDLYNIMNKELMLLARNDKVTYIDSRHIFDNRNYTIFSDDVHFADDEGYRLLSEYIASFFSEDDVKR